MGNPLISIIVPIYNAEVTLERALNSIAGQTLNDYEVLLVDDGSIDNSRNICDDLCNRDGRFKYIYQNNSGVSAARNKGLNNSKGEYIAFLDSDDYFLPDALETMYKNVKDTDSDISVVSFFDDKNDRQATECNVAILNSSKAFEYMLNEYMFSGYVWNKLFKKEIIDDIRFNEDIKLYEDMVFCGEAICRSKSVVYTQEKKYQYIPGLERGSIRKGYLTAERACSLLQDLCQNSCPENRKYISRLWVETYLSFANKAVLDKSFTKELYSQYKKRIAEAKRNDCAELRDTSKKKLILFQLGPKLFKFICKIYARV